MSLFAVVARREHLEEEKKAELEAKERRARLAEEERKKEEAARKEQACVNIDLIDICFASSLRLSAALYSLFFMLNACSLLISLAFHSRSHFPLASRRFFLT